MKKTRLALLFAAFATVALGFVGCQPEVHHHHWDEGTVIVDSNCTDNGFKIFRCTDSDCGQERTESIVAKGHSYDWKITGDKHWQECSRCGRKIEEADHSFTLITTDPVKHWKECSGCGKKIEEVDHDFNGNGWQECSCGRKSPVSLNILGTYDSTKMTFGVYPQTIKASDVTVDKSVKNTEITGAVYYLGSDGAWYAECVENGGLAAIIYELKYSDGSLVSSKPGSVKYFKVEPIEWTYLEETKCLHAKKILTANKWIDENTPRDKFNYANSDIRSWLNGTFYDSAFTESQKKKIKTTTVDNSKAYIEYLGDYRETTVFTCEDTQDKIFLLSLKEATAPGNGFKEEKFEKDDSRCRFPTDYALANDGAGSSWFLRTPYASDRYVSVLVMSSSRVYDIQASKELDRDIIQSYGVVPALSINE